MIEAAPPRRLLGTLDALVAAIERARAELPCRGPALDAACRDNLEIAAGDVLRALVWARHRVRELEHSAALTLDDIAFALGASGRLAG